MGSFLGAFGFAFLLLLAIFFHELGHYSTARWSGIKITKFFVGFGPTLWSFRRGRPEVVETPDGELVERPETEYGVKALPLGGFVKVVGMSPFEDVAPEDYPRSFRSAPAWKRAIVLAAGSATHFITAFVFLVLIFSALGTPDPDRPTTRIDAMYREIGGKTSPAIAAGLRPGDEIVAVDGKPAGSWLRVRETIRAHPGQPLVLRVRNEDGRIRDVTVTPAKESDKGKTIGVIGVAPAYEITRLNPIAGAGRSISMVGSLTASFIRETPKAFSLRNLGLVPGEKPSDQRPLSLVGAGRIAADLAATGEIALFLFFFVQVNLFIGIVNMLPLPPLDGGHLLLLGVEKVRRGKPVDQRALVPVMAVVTSLLIILAVSLLFQDIFSPVRLPLQ